MIFPVLTLIDLFNADFSNCLKLNRDLQYKSEIGTVPFTRSICYDESSGSKFVAVYFPGHDEILKTCRCLLESFNVVFDGENGVGVYSRKPTDIKPVSYKEFSFSNRAYFYTETDILQGDREGLEVTAKQHGIHLIIRDLDYLNRESAIRKPLAFISHDSQDKSTIARPVAVELLKLQCPVWYDEFSLKMGDPLRNSIEKGLRECKKCVLILTPNYISNMGWALKEFDSIFTREMFIKERVILPIWSGVTAKDVYELSPSLADIKAETWTGDAKAMADVIKAAVQRME